MKETVSDYRLEHLRKILGDRYRVVGLLGRGAFASVYLVENLRLERKEALKVLSDAYDESSRFLHRFIDEAKLVASLDHPNIVKVYDYGEVAGTLWMSMQYIDGPTLRSELEASEQMMPDLVARLGASLLDALAYSHSQGIVHRDVKPSNILLNRRGTPFLMDFGIAKATRSSLKTMTGSVLGTPTYMAPEQAEGLPLDGRADLYALASVLYELLAGVPPYQGNDPVHILVQRLRDDPKPLAEVCPEVAPPIADAIMRSLERDPDNRFPDAVAMQRALEDWLGSRTPQRLRPATAPEILPISKAEVLAARTAIDSAEMTVRTRPRDSTEDLPGHEDSSPDLSLDSHSEKDPAVGDLSAESPPVVTPAGGRVEEPRRSVPKSLWVALLLLVLAAGWWWGRSSSEAPSSDRATPLEASTSTGGAPESASSDTDPALVDGPATLPDDPASTDSAPADPAESDSSESNNQPPAAAEGLEEGSTDPTPTANPVGESPRNPLPASPPPPVAPPPAPIRRPVEPPRILEAANPEPSAEVLEQCAGVSVILSVSVGEDGRAQGSRVLGSAPEVCRRAAQETAERYRFDPALDLDGRPIEASISISLRFDVPEQETP